jgi:hypothetical protein
VDPNHHGLPCLGVQRTGPNVQVQAIFTLTLGARLEHRTGSLRAYRAELVSLSDPRPFSNGDRQPPTAFADRWLGIGHTQELENPILTEALDEAFLCPNGGIQTDAPNVPVTTRGLISISDATIEGLCHLACCPLGRAVRGMFSLNRNPHEGGFLMRDVELIPADSWAAGVVDGHQREAGPGQ